MADSEANVGTTCLLAYCMSLSKLPNLPHNEFPSLKIVTIKVLTLWLLGNLSEAVHINKSTGI